MHAGTVSKILWHFTGGKTWDEAAGQYSGPLKSHSSSADVLKLILESKTLKVGGFKEKIMIDGQILETNRVCCVADIPAVSLRAHSKRYGKCAIGFHREALLQGGFNPVFYIRQDKTALTELQSSFRQVANLDFDSAVFMNILQRNFQNKVDADINDAVTAEYESMKEKIKSLKSTMEYFQSFIKTINEPKEWNDIYLEREWRYPHNYEFGLRDIAMIVLPKDGGIYEQFCESDVAKALPRKIPIIAYEDLVEH